MDLGESIRSALRSVYTNRLRSVLTMLGIIIGVSAVILLVAIGNGVRSSVSAGIEPLANLITVVPVKGNVPGGGAPKDLTDTDVAALQTSEQATDIASVTPAVTGRALVETDTGKLRSSVTGSTEHWAEVNNRKLDAGSFFDEAQARSTARVVVLGPTVATHFFGDDHFAGLGRSVKIHRQTFKVIGVMQAVGEPDDSSAVIPLKTARRYIFGDRDKVNEIIVQAVEAAAVPAAEQQMISILTNRHRIKDPVKRDFEAQSLRSLLDTYNKTLRILALFTASVAGISLLVGGIGVMNTMLVSVTERTREIGIRKALGGTRRAILQQFLIESVVLAGLGGVLGILVGTSLSFLAATIAHAAGPTMATFAPSVTISSIAVSFVVSLAVGLVAGGYPANRAARLRPVEALRYE